MFEREVMIGTLKHQSDNLKKLIGELEEKPKADWQETQYYHESLKKIESALKRVRRIDEDEYSGMILGSGLKYSAHSMRMRDIS